MIWPRKTRRSSHSQFSLLETEKVARVTFVSPQGDVSVADGPTGVSLMSVARLGGIVGIEAECGGSLSCATCHVYLDEADVGKVPPASPNEEEMLDLVAAERTACSRLSCQIMLSDEMDGLVIHVPSTQY